MGITMLFAFMEVEFENIPIYSNDVLALCMLMRMIASSEQD